MHSNEENSGSESENDFESLFEEKNPEESVFCFKNISVQSADCIREVTYTFNVDDSVDLSCSLTIAEDLSSIPLDVIERMLVAIGLCTLPWYWMGFGTRRIVIEKSVGRSLSEDMVQFWNVLYEKVLLEFMYVNKLNWAVPKLEVMRDNCSVSSSEDASRDDKSVPLNGDGERSKKSNNTTSFSDSFNFSPASLSIEVEAEVEVEADRKQIIPLGGGKDSLVAWHLARSQGLHPVLLYVADGMEEFENNWRLNEIVRTIGTDIHIVKHVFTNSTFENRCRSYLKPCGHPWAALVLFDSVLISSALGINSVSFGYEKSADYGNGIEINGVEVNHQYDKSSEFLHLAQQYCYKYLNNSLNLTSDLSKMWELEIAKIFCLEKKLKKFHRLFLSCNEPINDVKKIVEVGIDAIEDCNHLVPFNSKKKMIEKMKNREENFRKNNSDVESSADKVAVAIDLKNKQTKCEWCCACEKCAFIFLLLSAWMPLQEVVQVFGINMFEDEGCLEVFLSLIGADGRKKPFECVGTFDEAKASVCLALRRWEEALIKRDAVPCVEAVDAHTVPSNSEMKGEQVGEGDDLNNDRYEKENKDIEEERHCNTSTPPLPLPLPPLPDFSSMPLILGILRTQVHLDFHDMKYFHLITEEEILNTYGMAFSN